MNVNEYMNENSPTPIIPLSNPGDDSPAYSGNQFMPDANDETTNGGNTNSGPASGAINSGNSQPIIPLPGAGASAPAPGISGDPSSGNPSSGFQGTVITVLPRPVTPCFYCNSSSYGAIRFLNAAVGYNPFVISVNNRTAADTLEYAEISEYGRVSSGYQTITVSGRNGYIYISKQIRVTVGSTMTIAIVNTAGGLDLAAINDATCHAAAGGACIRACDLSYNAGTLTVSTYSGNIAFQNISFMDVTDYLRVVPASYELYVSNANETLLFTEITIRGGSQYTIFLFNWSESPTAIRTLIVEDRQ